MVDREESRLKGMDLTKLNGKDTFVHHEEEWDSRNYIHDKLKNSDLIAKKPIGNYFEIVENPEDKVYVSCHLIVPVVVTQATIGIIQESAPVELEESADEDSDESADQEPAKDATAKSSTDKKSSKKAATKDSAGRKPAKEATEENITLDADYDWAMEEAEEWSKEHLTFDELVHKDKYLPFKHASDPDTYPVPNYYEYVPSHVRNAEEKYRTKSFNKHIRTHANLKMDDIKVSYRMLKCNMTLLNDQKMQHHYKKVHLLPNGFASLRKRETINVNTDMDFKIIDLTNFQDVSQNKQNKLLDKIYTLAVATGVFEESSSRNDARINKSRSTDFINEMKKVCLQNYFERFKFSLRNIINRDVNDDFVCTWQNIEDAMLQAVGKENEVNLIYAFNKIKSSDFHSKPLEIIFADVDSKIDESLGRSTEFHKDTNGRMISPYSYSTYYKYNLILGVIENLEGEFCQLKEYIEQKISNMFNDCKTLVDISIFQKELIEEFTSKNAIKMFRTKDVPNPNNKPSVNKSEVSEKKKNESTNVRDEFKKKKIDMIKDLETAKELVTGFISKCNESNKNTFVKKIPEILTVLNEKKWRICGECMSSNCQLMQHLCNTHKVQKRFLGKCKGKNVKLGELPETLKDIEARIAIAKKKSNNASQNAASITSNVNSYSQSSDAFFEANPDLLDDDYSPRQTRGNTAIFSVKLSNLLEITKKTLPKWKKMKENKRYKCLICGKRNLTLDRYDEHMTCFHEICLKKPDLEEYCRARDMWIHIKEKSSPKELETLTCDYDSETGMRYSENESGTESNTEDLSDQDEIQSSAESRSSSDSEDNIDHEEDDKKARKNLERRKPSKNMENRFNEMEDEIEEIQSTNYDLKNSYNSKTRGFNKLEENLINMKSSLEEANSERAKLESHVQTLLSAKSDIDSINITENLIEKVNSLIKKETDERIYFSKKIEERFTKMETAILAEKLDLEKSITIVQHDPEVVVSDNNHVEYNYNTNTSSSVVNSKQENRPDTPIQQLSTITPGIKTPVKPQAKQKEEEISPNKTPNNSNTKNIKSKNILSESTEKFNAGRYITEGIINNSTQVTKEIFKVINTCLNNNMGWGLLVIIFFLCNSAKAAPTDINAPPNEGIMEINGTSIQSPIPEIFSPLSDGMKTIIYGATTVVTKNYILRLGNVEERITEDISDSCEAVATQNNICDKDIASCPMVHLNKENYGNAIRKSFQTFTALGLACETKRRGTSTEAINLCLDGKDWILPRNATAAFSFLDMMQTGFTHDYLKLEMDKIHSSLKKRSLKTGSISLKMGSHKELAWNLFWQEISLKGSTTSIHDSPASVEHALSRSKRLVISGPLIFATIMGILATATSAATAHVISVNEAHKVMKAEALHREEDIENGIANNYINLEKNNNLSISVDRLRHVSTHSSNAVTHVMDALDLNNRITHWMIKDKTIQYSDPALEEFSGDIRSMVMRDTKGLLKSEIESMIRLASNTATMVTTIIPLAGSSNLCNNRLLMKTLYVTLVNHRTRTVIVKEGNRLYPNSGDKSRYLLIPQDGILSKSAELFNQEIHINASTGPTPDPLFQIFTLQIPENMTIVESCPTNQSWVKRKWTIPTFTRLELPITCKINSERFNCSAISLQSSETKEVHFPHHRMTIMRILMMKIKVAIIGLFKAKMFRFCIVVNIYNTLRIIPSMMTVMMIVMMMIKIKVAIIWPDFKVRCKDFAW